MKLTQLNICKILILHIVWYCMCEIYVLTTAPTRLPKFIYNLKYFLLYYFNCFIIKTVNWPPLLCHFCIKLFFCKKITKNIRVERKKEINMFNYLFRRVPQRSGHDKKTHRKYIFSNCKMTSWSSTPVEEVWCQKSNLNCTEYHTFFMCAAHCQNVLFSQGKYNIT